MFQVLTAVARGMIRGLYSAFLIVLLGTAIATAASADEGVYQRIDASRDQMIHRIQQDTGITVGEFFIEPDPGTEGSYRITVFDRKHLYRSQVVISDVTHDNLRSKLDDAVAVIVSDVSEKREALLVGDSFLVDVVNADDWSPAIGTSAGVTLSFPWYATVWVQLPGIEGGEVDVLSVHGTSQWLRTTIEFEGVLHGPNEAAVVVGRAATSIWQVETRDENERRVVSAGTLEGSLRHDVGIGESRVRLDVDAVRWSSARAYPVADDLKLFYNTSLRLGLRLIEESEGAFRFVLGKTLQVGMIIADRLFISAKLNSEIDYVSNSLLTIGFDAGWRLSRLLTLKVGANYRLSNPLDYGVDDMYLMPGGWTFTAGAFMRF